MKISVKDEYIEVANEVVKEPLNLNTHTRLHRPPYFLEEGNMRVSNIFGASHIPERSHFQKCAICKKFFPLDLSSDKYRFKGVSSFPNP